MARGLQPFREMGAVGIEPADCHPDRSFSYPKGDEKRSGNSMSECVFPQRSWASCSLGSCRNVKKKIKRTIAVSGNKRILLA